MTTPGARRAMERVTAAIKVCLLWLELRRLPPIMGFAYKS